MVKVVHPLVNVVHLLVKAFHLLMAGNNTERRVKVVHPSMAGESTERTTLSYKRAVTVGVRGIVIGKSR